jgi:hypothetical protein
MHTTSKLAALAATAALGLAPAAALAHGSGGHGKSSKSPGHTKTSQAEAYGRYCQGESKTHVKGEKGTAFSRCVTAMAKIDKAESRASKPLTPEQAKKLAREACSTESKTHVAGEKGTAFSRCIVAAAHLTRDMHKSGSSA